MVSPRMLGNINEFEILKAVIYLVAVDVVDLLVPAQLTSYVSLHDYAVL